MVQVFILVPLLLSFMQARGGFPENLVVVRRMDQSAVTLTCGRHSDANVTWRFGVINVENVGFYEDLQWDGPTLTVKVVEPPMLGCYSCWSGKEMVSSTHLMMEAEDEEEIDSLLTCRAKSYGCRFECKWLPDGYGSVRLGLGPDCLSGGSSCRWFDSPDQDKDGRISFNLSHSLSPSTEESTMLELSVEAIKENNVLRKTKMFYLRDIVQPDRPRIVKCQFLEQNLSVTIDPADTWSKPYSFYMLEHQIQYMLKGNGEMASSSSALIPKEISKLRVHSRDLLVHSTWSQWTPWKRVNALPTVSGSVCR